MTTATKPAETLIVSRAILIDAVAALLAAAGLAHIEDEGLYPEYRADAISGEAGRLQEAVFGPLAPDEDDPLEVELQSRSSELEAQMIDQCMEWRIHGEKARASLMARDGRSAQLREYARLVREAGTLENVTFPTSASLLEKVRAEMNAAIEKEADDGR